MSNYVPRLTASGIYRSPYWYDDNIFYQYGWGLPNCTCYAWGRWRELLGHFPTDLSTGDAEEWYDDAVNTGVYATGQTPKLGAIACYRSIIGGSGHVSVVEEITGSTFTTSNSGYYRPVSEYPPDTPNFFYPNTITRSDRLADWMVGRYEFQGFIYNPIEYSGTFPIWLLFKLKERRGRR